MMRPAWIAVAAVACVLALTAFVAPDPARITDRGTYEAIAARVIVPDCNDLHCFRVLVPWILGRLPGPSIVRWKSYAVVANTAAAAAVFFLAITLGLSPRGAAYAAAMSGFGFGAFYTVYDCYTADPLMFAVGPVLTTELLRGRALFASATGA